MQSKPLQAAIIFGIVIISFAALLGQAGNFFSKAQGTPKITGTIVLLDDTKYKYEYTGAGNPVQVGIENIQSSVALPGATTCNVQISGCCEGFLGNPASTSTISVSLGSISKSLQIGGNGGCTTAAGSLNLNSASVYTAAMTCTNSYPPTYLSVAYSCT